MRFLSGPVRVQAPATSANLGPGFDALGLALAWHDEVVAEVTGEGLEVSVTGEGADDLPRDERHLVVRAMRATFETLGVQPPGLRVACRNRIPQARGLGSSAAAVVAGILAARALVADGAAALDDAAVLQLACRLEGHPDNVAACLLGGLTVAWWTDDRPRAVRLTPVAGLNPVVFVPAVRGLTEAARAALPEQVPHADAAHAAGRVALLVHALTHAPEHLFDATEDRLHQRYRATGMPETAALVHRLRAAGVAAVVSGAGPSVLALSPVPPELSAAAEVAGFARRAVTVDPTGATVAVGRAAGPG